MGLRESLESRPAIVYTVVGVLVAIALFVALRSSGVVSSDPVPQAFYTTGDATAEAAVAGLFTDDDMQPVPFTHDGKPAYKAIVYTVDGERREVGYLMRFRDDFVKKVNEATDEERKTLMQSNEMIGATLVKRPGGEWTIARSQDGSKVMELPAANPSFRLLRPGESP